MNDSQHHLSDDTLVAQVLKGNRKAFETIMHRHRQQVTRIVSGRVPQEKIEEMLQETFIRAYKSLPGYRKKKPLAHWLAVIAVRTCLDSWRRVYKKREIPISHLGEDAVNWLIRVADGESHHSAGSMQTENQKEAARVLQWAMERISPKERMVLSLTHLEGYTAAQAAELLGWSRSNVKVRALRARNKLRDVLRRAVAGTG